MEPRFVRDFSKVPASHGPQRSGTELTIAPANDRYEQEADHLAAQIVWGSAPASQTPPSENRRQDFSGVRVHTDARGGGIGGRHHARAYTVGRDVVFAPGQYAPHSTEGRGLLAHELTHVVQQAKGASPGPLQRKGGTIGGFFANLWSSFAGLFTGRDATFAERTLQSYLLLLDKTGDIEDDFDSDDKARAIVRSWRENGTNFVLTAQRKALLIREMLGGFAGDDDEKAVLELLQRSYSYELKIIFGAGGVSPHKLRCAFHGAEFRQLDEFFDGSFEGGKKAVLAGNISPRQGLTPLGKGAC
jgi:hypothetical protein